MRPVARAARRPAPGCRCSEDCVVVVLHALSLSDAPRVRAARARAPPSRSPATPRRSATRSGGSTMRRLSRRAAGDHGQQRRRAAASRRHRVRRLETLRCDSGASTALDDDRRRRVRCLSSSATASSATPPRSASAARRSGSPRACSPRPASRAPRRRLDAEARFRAEHDAPASSRRSSISASVASRELARVSAHSPLRGARRAPARPRLGRLGILRVHERARARDARSSAAARAFSRPA